MDEMIMAGELHRQVAGEPIWALHNDRKIVPKRSSERDSAFMLGVCSQSFPLAQRRPAAQTRRALRAIRIAGHGSPYRQTRRREVSTARPNR
jgi:hypothetical protein